MINATTIAAILTNLTDAHIALLAEIVRYWKSDDALSERCARSVFGDEDLFCDLGRAGLIRVEGPSYDWTRARVHPTAFSLEIFRLVNPEFPGCPTFAIEPRDAHDCSLEVVEELPLFVEVEAEYAPGGYIVTGELEAWRTR